MRSCDVQQQSVPRFREELLLCNRFASRYQKQMLPIACKKKQAGRAQLSTEADDRPVISREKKGPNLQMKNRRHFPDGRGTVLYINCDPFVGDRMTAFLAADFVQLLRGAAACVPVSIGTDCQPRRKPAFCVQLLRGAAACVKFLRRATSVSGYIREQLTVPNCYTKQLTVFSYYEKQWIESRC